MKSRSDNIEFMIYNNPDEVIEELFESILSKCQIWLEKTMRGSDFVFDWVYLLYFKCRKVNSNLGESYIDSPDWIKKINHNKTDYKCFQYAATFALNHKEIGKDSERITKIKPYGNKLSIRKRWLKKTWEK